jgi:hypothetical protein
MSMASPLGDIRLAVGLLADPTIPPDSGEVLLERCQVNGFPTALPAFRAERHIVPVLKVVTERRARVHPCPQIRLSFEANQLGDKFEILAHQRKELALQLEDQLHQLGVVAFRDYVPDLFERAKWVHLLIFRQKHETRTSLGKV